MIAKNYRGHYGEVDLIMQDGNTLVFVEVRFRKNALYGNGHESITTQKQQRILSTAQEYLQYETKIKNGRIDVVAMSEKPQNTDKNNNYIFDWIKNAF